MQVESILIIFKNCLQNCLVKIGHLSLFAKGGNLGFEGTLPSVAERMVMTFGNFEAFAVKNTTINIRYSRAPQPTPPPVPLEPPTPGPHYAVPELAPNSNPPAIDPNSKLPTGL